MVDDTERVLRLVILESVVDEGLLLCRRGGCGGVSCVVFCWWVGKYVLMRSWN